MKNMIFALTLVILPTLSFAADISTCAKDEYTRERIQKSFADFKDNEGGVEALVVKNPQGEVVGAMFLNADNEVYSAYLCGANSGYYYVENTVDQMKKGGVVLYNDEYDSDVKNFKFDKKTNTATFDISIAFIGEEEDADYEKFTSTLVVEMTPQAQLPKLN